MTDKQRMEGAKFRIINERLYTTSSAQAGAMFRDTPANFELMHRGFVNQAKTWPIVPVDEAIKWIKTLDPSTVVADMGCGDAKIAAELNNKVYSFDFQARNARVTPCDMSHTPLEPASVDVVTFVLSLMGTNLSDFVREARRIIREDGMLLVIEVTSRIENLDSFVQGIEDRGFELSGSKELTNFFTWFEFKVGREKLSPAELVLKPCIYKRR